MSLAAYTSQWAAHIIFEPQADLCKVLPLQTSLSLDTHLTSNHRSALNLSLLLLPPSQPFSELALWEQIAGISYSGDPRMSVPGAENPEKVKNIVRGEGVLEGFRGLYEGSMKEVPGLRWEGQEKGGQWNWTGRGEELLAVIQLPLCHGVSSFDTAIG